MMVDAGFSDLLIGLNGSATCIGVILALFILPRLLRTLGAFAVVVLGLAGSVACLVAFPYNDPDLAWLLLSVILGGCLNVILVVSGAWLNAVPAELIRALVFVSSEWSQVVKAVVRTGRSRGYSFIKKKKYQ